MKKFIAMSATILFFVSLPLSILYALSASILVSVYFNLY